VSGSVLVFDGDCGFCTASARFVERYVRTEARVVAWQHANLTEIGLTPAQCVEAVQWVGADGRRGAGAAAVGQLLQAASPGWKPLGWLLLRPPVRWLAEPVYRWVARHRHQLPGGTPACALTFTEGDRVHLEPSDQ
jgi:predicted DCC family thiol-disulfide oxidoreductase YuxK